ncbi:MAG: polysaccharide biosynthesis tyrosine autokinase [Desulfobacteraceae bacterium]|jgi:capsular exopolysaccharide synthesis family protein
MKNDDKCNGAMPPSTHVTGGQYLPSTEYRDAVPEWDPEEVDLRDYLDVILRRRWLMVNCLLIVFVSVLILTLSQTKIYKATTTIEVGAQNQNVTKFEEVETSNLRATEYYDTQVQLVQSREILERVVDRLNLGNHPVLSDDDKAGLIGQLKAMVKDLILSFIPRNRQESEDAFKIDEEMFKRQALIEFMEEGLDVSSSRTAMLIDIGFASEDRHLSQAVANAVADEFVRWQMEKKLEASDMARNFLMKQIDRAKINLENAEEALNGFAKKARIVSMDSKLNSILGQLEKLNEALAVAKTDLIEKKAAYEQAKKDGSSALPEVMESEMIGRLKADYVAIQAEYERMSVTFHDEYPAVKALIGRMNSIKERIRGEEEKVFRTIRHRYETGKTKVAQMEKRLEAQKQLTLKLNERTTQYAIMAREVETNQQIYQSLLERSREIESMTGISSSNIHVVDEASLPLLPSKPNVKLNLLLGLVLGVMGGIGLAFLLEYFTDRVANPDEISERYQIPILGVAPLAKKRNVQLEKAFVEDPRSPFAEAMRTTRVSLQLSGAGDKSKSFVITSTRPGEGKTTMAANLALTFAGAGEKVVVVDADMRRPRIHHVFNVSDEQVNGWGLSSFLAGAKGDKLLQSNGVGNLRLVAAGPIPPNPVELLASNRFAKLIKALEKRFDRVIVDGPPHQGFADILVICQHVGGVVLVSSMGETTRESLRHFKKSMMNVNGHILGCIINKVDLTRRYGYQSYYNGYYGYASGEKRKRTMIG